MSAIQLSFSLRLSSGVKTVHLLGSWDNYVRQLPLSKDKNASKSGTWKGTFRFGGSTVQAGQRYWYYYIVDGYHVCHNPSEPSTVEPTTGRDLNILDVPAGKSSSKDKSSSSSSSKSHSSSSSKSSSRHSSKSTSSSSSSKDHKSSRHKSHLSIDIPKGRPLSTSQIKAPKPMSPHATKHILNGDYDEAVDELAARLGSAGLEDYGGYDEAFAEEYYCYETGEYVTTDFGSPDSGDDILSPISSTLSSRSGSSSPSSGLSDGGYSTPASSDCGTGGYCTCERFGITRKGERVRLDCGGTRCGGYADDSSSLCSSEGEDDAVGPTSSRRNGIVIRH